ncbi:hypothetical protein C8Q77DRAFT_1056463 [Trametes polyzona]|nr:hypothetical protein C8Q77DRAFT_1056463 [Trametes polyzona]
MPAPAVPIELCEHAIDFLDDECSLRATSLVCKALVSRSRIHLFRVIKFTAPDALSRFRDLLTDAPHIADYVEGTHISENSFFGVLRPSMAIAAQLPLVLAHHTRVRPARLSIHSQLWEPTRYSPDYSHSLSRLSSLTALDLYNVTFTTMEDFALVLRALAHLESLSAKELDYQRRIDPETAANIGCVLPSLSALTITSYLPTSVVDWLIQYNNFPSLRQVECCYELSTRRTDQALGTFWVKTAGTLEHLSIRILKGIGGIRVPLEVIEKQLDLSPCRALRSLSFDCRHEHEVVPDWRWLAWLLSHVVLPALHTLLFAFQSSTQALAAMHGFTAQLDNMLAGTLFSQLGAVVFQFDYRDAAVDPREEQLLALFPKIRALNLLHGTL